MNAETVIQEAVRLALGAEKDLVLWRNSTGQTEEWSARGGVRHMRYGLARGSADLVGILAPHGRLVALEVKTPTGRVAPEQEQWLELVRRMGGFACVVRSVADARGALARARMGAAQ